MTHFLGVLKDIGGDGKCNQEPANGKVVGAGPSDGGGGDGGYASSMGAPGLGSPPNVISNKPRETCG